MADINQILKEGLKGAIFGAVADTVLHGGIPIETAAAIGATAGGIIGGLDENDKEPQSHSSSTRKSPEPHFEPPSMNLNTANNSSFGSPQGVMSGGAVNTTNNPYDWNNIPEPKIWIRPDGDGRTLWNSDYSENDNYSERMPNDIHDIFYEPIKSETDKCESCVTTKPPKKELSPDLQASIDRWKGKSPSRACDKHGVEMPTNSCYSCNGGGKCEHLSIYNGSHKEPHCTFSGIPHEPNLSDNPMGSPPPHGKPLKQHRKSNRTHLTGIERDNLLGLADKTLVDDKESLKQEFADHIDETLTFAENKTILEDYLSGVTPMSDRITEREVKETEDRMAQDWQNKVSARRWEDVDLIEGLKTRADMGDMSASAELELLEIQRNEASFVAPAPLPYIPPSPTLSNPVESFAPTYEPAPMTPIMEPAQNRFDNISNPQNQMPLPLVETAHIAPDPIMDWCSSTPETIKFSESFVPPVETFNPVESWIGTPLPEAMKKSTQNSFGSY